MRKKFSERYGFKQPREAFQINSIDDRLKNRLWNNFIIMYIDIIKLDIISTYIADKKAFNFVKEDIYDGFFGTNEEVHKELLYLKKDLKEKFFNLNWHEIYDFTEYIPNIFYNDEVNNNFRLKINKVLEEEMSGYRFVDEFITPIIDDVEIKEIEEALNSQYSGVKNHLSNSLELLSDRENPDYINSIKESISAVESLCKIITDKNHSALGACLNQLTFDVGQHFKQGVTKLYNWTSTADGIRHGNTEETITSSFAEAKYMLVICSAFVNYMIEKSNNEQENEN